MRPLRPYSHNWASTHSRTYGTYLLLYASGAHEKASVAAETKVQVKQRILKFRAYLVEFVDEPLLLGEQRDAAVQCA